MGYGICKYWAIYADCQDEEVNSGVKALITIGYTNEELSIETAYAYTAYWVYPDIHVQYPELGYNYTETADEHSDDYWTAIKERITTSLKATDMVPDTLLLLGETAANERFVKVVMEVLSGMEMEWKAKVGRGWEKVFGGFQYGIQSAKPPLMLAARGAAEFAKRIQGEPNMCVEVCFNFLFLGYGCDILCIFPLVSQSTLRRSVVLLENFVRLLMRISRGTPTKFMRIPGHLEAWDSAASIPLILFFLRKM